MTMTIAIQIGVLVFMTLLPIVLSVIHYVVNGNSRQRRSAMMCVTRNGAAAKEEWR